MRALHPVVREVADLLADLRDGGRQGVVVAWLEPHHSSRLGGSKPDRKHRPEHDRHLAEDVSRIAVAQHPLDAVDHPDRLDSPFDHREQRALIPLVRGVLAGDQGDICRAAADLLALGLAEACEHLDGGDLLWRDQRSRPGRVRRASEPAVWVIEQ